MTMIYWFSGTVEELRAQLVPSIERKALVVDLASESIPS